MRDYQRQAALWGFVLCAGLALPPAAHSQSSGTGSKAAIPQADRKLDAPFVAIRAAVTADLVAFLRTRGATELTEFRDQDTITARVPDGEDRPGLARHGRAPKVKWQS